MHASGTASDENILDTDRYHFDHRISKQPERRSHSNLTRTDSSSCPDFDDFNDDTDHFSQSRRVKTQRKSALKQKSSSKRFSTVFSSNDSSTSSRDVNGSQLNSQHCKRKKNVYFDLHSADSSSSADEYGGLGDMNALVKQRAESYEHAICYGNGTDIDLNYPSTTRSRTPSFKKAVESGTSGDSGISNDFNGNDTLTGDDGRYVCIHENEPLTITTGNRNAHLLRPSRFRSGVYDRANVHLPANQNAPFNTPRDNNNTMQSYRQQHNLTRQPPILEHCYYSDNPIEEGQGDSIDANYIDYVDDFPNYDAEVAAFYRKRSDDKRQEQEGLFGRSQYIDMSTNGSRTTTTRDTRFGLFGCVCATLDYIMYCNAYDMY